MIAGLENGISSRLNSAPITPKKSKKRVRFSDPGPRLPQDVDIASTGLTPAMRRTSFDPNSGDCTPSRKARRRSAQTPRPPRLYDQVEHFDESCTERRIQFTPLRQILDPRTQRRIKRSGLSDEMNHIEQEKRDAGKLEKTMKSLREERDTLKNELRLMKQSPIKLQDQEPAGVPYSAASRSPRSSGTISVASNHDLNDTTHIDDDTFMLNDSAVIMSNSTDFCSAREGNLLFTASSNGPQGSSVTNPSDDTDRPDVHSLALDLEAARNEKRNLFNACRSRISKFNEPGLDNLFKDSSPQPEFFDNLLEILSTALSRASDAADTLREARQECSSFGFSGEGVADIICDMRSHFRSARLELERIVPGETSNVSLEDGKSTLRALVKRVESLAQDLGAEQHYHHGTLGREKALRGQFDALLHRHEEATAKINNLEDSIASSAGDMLHTRIKMQNLEREGQEQAVGIDRLNAALDKYHDEVKGLEGLIESMEKESTATKENYTRQISNLRKNVAHECSKRALAEAETCSANSRIQELEKTVGDNRARVCDLTAQVELLEKEYQMAMGILEENASDLQGHKEKAGILNVRVSELTTSLDSAKSEVERLGLLNHGLEKQLQAEIETRNELLDKWAVEQLRSFVYMKETINSERRKAKIRAANRELKSDDLISDGTTAGSGSEPITPVSMTRFVDVEFRRGKGRRRIDSGIEILSEEELLKDDHIPTSGSGLDSDIDLPTSDFT